MGRNWIKIETVTMDKPEVCVVATQLKLDPDAVVGKLVRLWSWAEVNRINANAMNVTLEFLDKLVGKKGFAAALMKAGWLREVGGALQFPNFGRHNGPEGKGRALTAQRVSRHRERKRNSDDEVSNLVGDLDPGTVGSKEPSKRKVKAVNQRKNTVKELLESDLDDEKTSSVEKVFEIGSDDRSSEVGVGPRFDELDSVGIAEGANEGNENEEVSSLRTGGIETDFNGPNIEEVTVVEIEEAFPVDEMSPFDDLDEESPFEVTTEAEEDDLARQGAAATRVDVIAVESVASVEGESEGTSEVVSDQGAMQKGKKARGGGGRKSASSDTSDQPMLF